MSMKKQSLKRQAMITAGSGALVRGLGFVLRLWISRLLGAEALGIMELASGAHMLALTPAAAGLPGAVSHLTAKAEGQGRRWAVLRAGRRMALALGGIMTPLFLLLSPLIARWLGDGRTLPSLLLYSPCALLVGLSCVYDGWFFGQGRALPPALSEGAEQATRLAVLLGFSALAPRLAAAYRAALPALATTLGEGVGLLTVWLLAGRGAPGAGAAEERALQRRMGRLALPLMLNRLCHTGLRALTSVILPLRLMAGGLPRAEALSRLGMFSGMVMPLMMAPGLFSGALATVGAPAMARCRTARAEKRLEARMILSSLGVGLLCGGGLYLLSPLISLRLYHLPELSPLIRAACPLAVLLPVQQAVGGLMTGLGLQRKTLAASLLGAGATLLCTWRWAAWPRAGVMGAAYASLAGHGLTLLCSLIQLRLRRRDASPGPAMGEGSSHETPPLRAG